MKPASELFAVYDNHGVRFTRPEMWELTEEVEGLMRTITVNTHGSAFWVLTILSDCPSPIATRDAIIQALEDEYDDADRYPVEENFAGLPCSGMDMEFVGFEMVSTACVRVVRTTDMTLTLLWQCPDVELEEFRPVLDAMTRSVQLECLDD